MLYWLTVVICYVIHSLLSFHTFKQISERNAQHFLSALNIHILANGLKNSTTINWQGFNCGVKEAKCVVVSEHTCCSVRTHVLQDNINRWYILIFKTLCTD